MNTHIFPTLNDFLAPSNPGHLILTRRKGECIMIGEEADIVVRIVEVSQKGTIQLVIEAPKDVPVWRGEIYQKIKEQGQLRKKGDRNLKFSTATI